MRLGYHILLKSLSP